MAMSPTDVRTLLNVEQIDALRDAYRREVMVHAITNGAKATYGGSAAFLDSIGLRFYVESDREGRMSARDRERTIISALSASRGAGFAQAIHFYWGLMEGLSVEDIAEIVTLVGGYCGVETYTDSMFTLSETLKILSKLSSGEPTRAQCPSVLITLVGAFRSSPSASV